MHLLFNENSQDDLINILAYIDAFTKAIGVTRVEVNVAKIEDLLRMLKIDFPCEGGVKKASMFKQAAAFALSFTSAEPILTTFSPKFVDNELAQIRNHQNAILALQIALSALERAKICRSDGKEIEVSRPIEMSKHSYIDIVDALTRSSPSTGFLLTTVLFEQLTYKTNPECQYQPLINFSSK